MSWIDDEAARVRKEDEARSQREQAFTQQAYGLWEDLCHQIKQDVEKINQNKDLLMGRLHGTTLQFGVLSSEFHVKKITFPALYLIVKYHSRYISVEREKVENAQVVETDTERENISIEPDSSYRLFLKKGNGENMTVAQASQYLLTPFLYTRPLS